MNIPVSHLKKFARMSAHIKNNNVLPIYKYLKFGGGSVCKNVSGQFVNYLLPEADEELLVDENDLFSLVDRTATTAISITMKKGKVEIWDGRDKIVTQTVPYEQFPNPMPEKTEQTPLSQEFMDTLLQASYFSRFIKDQPTHYGNVQVGERAICAGDGIIVFHCPIEEDVKIVLDYRIAQTIAKYGIHSFQEADNYYYFFNETAMFGFQKSEDKWFDIRRIFQQERKFSFTVDASDLTSFNSLSLALSKDAICTLSDGKIEMNDSMLDKYHERPMENVKIEESFNYNPERLNSLIEGLGVEAMDFSDSKPAYFISSKDTKATAVIAKISKP